MGRLLFLFLDGVGLGEDKPGVNPFASTDMPHLRAVLGGLPLIRRTAPLETELATLKAVDARLGVGGLPQSATGQAVLLTGRNIPAELGFHYGPKPNPQTAEILRNGNIFKRLVDLDRKAALLNAYPPRYFEAIESGRRLFSSIPLAVSSAGIPLMTTTDLYAGRALSADFTGHGWRENLGFGNAPVLEPARAGRHLAALSRQYDLAFFEYWLTDLIGHRQDLSAAENLLARFDRVLGGLVDTWDMERDLILITSDHGNLEDLSTRRHTENPVPALIIGAAAHRERFANGLMDLTQIAPAILDFVEAS